MEPKVGRGAKPHQRRKARADDGHGRKSAANLAVVAAMPDQEMRRRDANIGSSKEETLNSYFFV